MHPIIIASLGILLTTGPLEAALISADLSLDASLGVITTETNADITLQSSIETNNETLADIGFTTETESDVYTPPSDYTLAQSELDTSLTSNTDLSIGVNTNTLVNDSNAVPVGSSLLLLGIGIAALVIIRKRKSMREG